MKENQSLSFPKCLAIVTALVFVTEQSDLWVSTVYYGDLIFIAYFFVEPKNDLDAEHTTTTYESKDTLDRSAMNDVSTDAKEEDKIEGGGEMMYHKGKVVQSFPLSIIDSSLTEVEKRVLRINHELNQIIQQCQQELDQEMEEEELKALRKGVSCTYIVTILNLEMNSHLAFSQARHCNSVKGKGTMTFSMMKSSIYHRSPLFY